MDFDSSVHRKTETDSCFDELNQMEINGQLESEAEDEQYLPDLSDESDKESCKKDDEDSRSTYTGSSVISSLDSGDPDNPLKPDSYLFCPKCGQWVKQDCQLHPTLALEDINEYIAGDAETGVTVIRQIPADAVLGSCEGVTVDVETGQDVEDGYLWEIDTFSSTRRFLYADNSNLHWSAYATQNSGDSVEPNVYAVQFEGDIFLRAARTVEVGERVSVYIGDHRPCHYGHPISKFVKPKKKQQPSTFRRIDSDDKSIWKCSKCEFETDGYSRMRYHAVMAHRAPDEKFPCKVCGKQLATPSSRYAHMKTHDNGINSRRFGCSSCSMSFRFKHHLKRHEWTVHRIGTPIVQKKTPEKSKPSEQWQCEICFRQFSTKQAKSRHVKNVHTKKQQETNEKKDDVPTACPQCGKILKSEVAMKVHTRKAHPTVQDGGKHKCMYCGKYFDGKPSLRYHLMRHSGEFPFHCKVCGFGYPTLSELRKHEKRSKKCGGKQNENEDSGKNEAEPNDQGKCKKRSKKSKVDMENLDQNKTEQEMPMDEQV